jgi:hypothetical protein
MALAIPVTHSSFDKKPLKTQALNPKDTLYGKGALPWKYHSFPYPGGTISCQNNQGVLVTFSGQSPVQG